MKRVLGLAFAAFVSLIIGGCSTIQGFPDPPATSTAASPEPGYQLSPLAIKAYNAATDALTKKALRNEIIDARMAAIDEKFGDFERAVYKEGIGWGLGTDWLVLALTAGTAIAGGTSTKTALAAVSTAVVGAQAAFDKRALFEKTLPALMAQMVAERETIRASIRNSEQLAVENYTWSAAESDLKRFEFAGSIPGAINAIAQDAGQKAATAKQDLQDIRKAVYAKTAAGDLLRTYWKPDGNVNPANEAKLKQWMSDNGISTTPGSIEMFIRGDVLESARVKAVKDLNLQK